MISWVPRAARLSALGVALFAVAGACNKKEERGGFTPPPAGFDLDAGPPGCPHQCSLDGRAVIDGCTGAVVETCAVDKACGGGGCQEPCAAAAAARSSNGCEFYFQIPRYDPQTIPQSCFATFIVNTSTQPVEVALELEGKALDVSGAMFRTNPGEARLIRHAGPIAPGESAILFVSDRDPNVTRAAGDLDSTHTACPDGVVPALLADVSVSTGVGSAFRLKTNVPVGLTQMYPFGGASSYLPSASLLLPVATWGRQHILVNGWESNVRNAGVQILASEDDTEVTILPTRDIQDGVGIKGTVSQVPVTYRIDKGQYLQITQFEELSGSTVSSTKPTTVFGGHACAYVPSSDKACDTLQQQIPAFEQWGSEYVGVGYRPRLGNEHEPMLYRILAARDETRLEYDPAVPPGAPTTMSAGEVVTFRSGTGDAFVVRTQDADHPVYLAAYMTGCDGVRLSYGGRGDPEFVNVIPTGQYLDSYSFYADPTYGDTSLVIVRAKTNGVFKNVWLECAGDLTDFRPVGTRGDFEFTRVDLAKDKGPGQKFGESTCTNGLQRMKSEGPFTATLWGWDLAASYAYPGGMAQRRLVKTPLDPIR